MEVLLAETGQHEREKCYTGIVDLYGQLLSKVLYPGWERVRGRETYDLISYLDRTERAPMEELVAAQSGALRRLMRHAYRHTVFYRERLDAVGVSPEDLRSADDLARLPLLEKHEARLSDQARTSLVPPFPSVVKQTSGTTGAPMIVRYNQESRVWRDALRWRGYGWAGYRPGMKAFHYWGVMPIQPKGWKRYKVRADRKLRRDHYVDCTPRGDDSLAAALAQLQQVKPDVIVAYTQGAAALARYINRTGARVDPVPVLCGAERLWPHDREAMEQAFGPNVFETYGSREFMLMGAECEVHDGLHTTMENLVVEVIVRENGVVRAARPGEAGELVVTDLHNLSHPLIRYVVGDMAVARDATPCPCGRTLPRIGPIDGRVTDTLRDGQGNPVNGLIFSILFAFIAEHSKQFQVFQKKSGDLSLRVVPSNGGCMPPEIEKMSHEFLGKYLPGVTYAIEYLDDIPAASAGKRHIVVVEK